jgi:hypothetical protein
MSDGALYPSGLFPPTAGAILLVLLRLFYLFFTFHFSSPLFALILTAFPRLALFIPRFSDVYWTLAVPLAYSNFLSSLSIHKTRLSRHVEALISHNAFLLQRRLY